MKIPETRTVCIQLLKCWGELLDEYKNIEPLFKQLETTLPTEMFVAGAQDIAMHLSGIIADRKLEPKCKTLIYVGQPRLPIGYINAKVAGVLHRYFDDPNYVIKGKFPALPPKTSGEVKQMIEDNCCPEEKKEIEAQ